MPGDHGASEAATAAKGCTSQSQRGEFCGANRESHKVSWSAHSQDLRSAGTMRTFLVRSGDGEEEAAGHSSVVERGCEDLKGSGQSEAVGAPGGEEAASDERRCGPEGDGARGEVSVDQKKAAIGALACDEGCRTGVRKGEGEVRSLFNATKCRVESAERWPK
jgi:hypothetical protein